MVTPVDLAYAAGIIDGEGTIGITEISVDGSRRINPSVRAYVSLAMTDSVIPVWFAETFGGSAHSYPQRRPNHKPITHWRLQGNRVAEFCAEILPYLRVKRQQAEIVLRFAGRTKTWTTRRLPPDELAARRQFLAEIRVLNQRGIAVGGQ